VNFTVSLEEEDRQMLLLAIAELSLSRPGWAPYLRLIADKLCGPEMFERFRVLNADRVKAERGPIGGN
jgi:hypothetical protein